MSGPSLYTLRRECTEIAGSLGMTPAEFGDWLGLHYLVRSVDDLGFVTAGRCRAKLQAMWDERMAASTERFREQDAALDRPFIFGGR